MGICSIVNQSLLLRTLFAERLGYHEDWLSHDGGLQNNHWLCLLHNYNWLGDCLGCCLGLGDHCLHNRLHGLLLGGWVRFLDGVDVVAVLHDDCLPWSVNNHDLLLIEYLDLFLLGFAGGGSQGACSNSLVRGAVRCAVGSSICSGIISGICSGIRTYSGIGTDSGVCGGVFNDSGIGSVGTRSCVSRIGLVGGICQSVGGYSAVIGGSAVRSLISTATRLFLLTIVMMTSRSGGNGVNSS